MASVATGVEHTCAVLVGGSAKCWGFNGLGGVGDGTISRQRSIPLDVIVSSVKPTPTATPCPPSGCPSPTPTPYVPLTGLDFSLALDANGDTTDDCQSRAPGPTTCNLQIGAPFNLKVRLNGLSPDIPNYLGMDIKTLYGGVTSNSSTFWIWPDCIFDAFNYSFPGVIADGCSTVGTSNYTGPLLRTVLTCSASGTVALDHGTGNTGLIHGTTGVYFYETQGVSDQLTINCVNLPPTPTFTPGPPTPQPVGGVALDLPSSGGGASIVSLILAASVMLVALGGAPLVARRALRR